MNDEIQIISDGDGLAVIGDPTLVESFLDAHDLASTELDLPSLWTAIGVAGAVAQAGAVVAANAGRWLQLTEQSAQALATFDPVVRSASGLMIGVVRGSNGQFQKMLEFTNLGGTLANPMAVAGLGTLMSQMAMMKKIREIQDYLAVMDEKIDEILRAHKDAVIAQMLGVDLVVESAMTVREHVGRVSEVTWSKVQGTSTVIAATQAYALRQLDGLADQLERITDVDELAKVTTVTEGKAREWVAVLAHCFRLEEAVAVLELDHVLVTSPQDLDQHRIGLRIARENRLQLISKSTGQLVSRMNAAAARANKWVLMNPINSPIVVTSSNRVTASVLEFYALLGIDRGDSSVEARRWMRAVGDLKDAVVEKGADGVDLGVRIGGGALTKARSATHKVAVGVAARTQSRPEEA